MGARLTDSAVYAHLWGTDEVARRVRRDARLQAWLDILVALAAAQAELGIIPRVVGGGHRRARRGRSARPRPGGGRDAAHLPLHAGLHPRR